jgi:peroxiredoxin
VDSFPQTFVIAPDGTIVERIVGVRVWDDPQVVAALRTRR